MDKENSMSKITFVDWLNFSIGEGVSSLSLVSLCIVLVDFGMSCLKCMYYIFLFSIQKINKEINGKVTCSDGDGL